jgi:hypothetical protein
VTLYAAPVSPRFATDLRADMVAETEQSGGSCNTPKVRSAPSSVVVPATDDAGSSGMAPLRDWYAQGPRWLLNGRLMGQAAIDTDGTGESSFSTTSSATSSSGAGTAPWCRARSSGSRSRRS